MNSGGALDAGPQYRALLKEVNTEFTHLLSDLQTKISAGTPTPEERYDFAAIKFWQESYRDTLDMCLSIVKGETHLNKMVESAVFLFEQAEDELRSSVKQADFEYAEKLSAEMRRAMEGK